jgi:hypothetical protein
MTITDSFLSNAAWLFFTTWSVILGAFSLAAFGRDLFPPKVGLDSPPQGPQPDIARGTRSRAH